MVKQPQPSAKTLQRYRDLGEELAGEGVSLGSMFGMPCYKAKGKAFAGVYGDDMVFKLRADDLSEALALKGAHLFDPMGGRPMKEWVVIPSMHAKRWRVLAESARSYTAS